MPIRLICSTDGLLCLRSATTSFWHNRCRRGPSTPSRRLTAEWMNPSIAESESATKSRRNKKSIRVGDIDLATLEGRANPRFVVTSLRGEQYQARALYEKLYCARGEMENRIKECQLDLFADRTSTGTMRANQLRLW